MQRGEVWLATWPADPALKARPVLIVSNDFRNSAPHLHDVVVAKLTGLNRPDGTRKPVNRAEDLVIRFRKDTIIRCASLYSVEKKILFHHHDQLIVFVHRKNSPP